MVFFLKPANIKYKKKHIFYVHIIMCHKNCFQIKILFQALRVETANVHLTTH